MTYQVNGKIEDTDFNSLANSVNTVWSTGGGSSNTGYGQTTTIPAVANNDLVQATNYWTALTNRISTIASHQGTNISAMTPSPSVNGKIIYLQNITTNLTTINNLRLNASSQGSTTTSTATSASTWNAKMTMTFSVTFASSNAARYYFNGGGQIGLSFSHPNSGGINTLINDICAEAGTIWISSPTSGTASLAGVSYNGVTKIGGVVSNRSVINSNFGYYAFTSTETQIFSQTGDTAPVAYNNSTLQIRSRAVNTGAGDVNRRIDFICEFDLVPNGLTVAAGTIGTVTLRPPSTSYLSDTWGTPTVTSSVTYDTVSPTTFANPGSYSYTVPVGVTQLRVTYPANSGVTNGLVPVTPGATYTVTIGNYGEGSSISGIFSASAYTVQVLSFNGIVDASIPIYQRVIGSTYQNYNSNGQKDASTLNQEAANAGVYYAEGPEYNHGDYPADIVATQLSSTNILFNFRAHITYYGGRGGDRAYAQVSTQPTAGNGYVMTCYIVDGYNGAAWSPIKVSIQQIVGLTILPL